jgi:glyoxylase-like metal-dependent hydrolase (beta-lactamase superfamily II)
MRDKKNMRGKNENNDKKDQKDTRVEEVRPGVYAYIQEDGGWFLDNAGFIVGENDAIVIDSLSNAVKTNNFINEIKKITDNPLSFLINTHHHTDHIWTNYLFSSKTICSERCREETLKEKDVGLDIYKKIFQGLDTTGAKILPQDITFDKELRIHQEISDGTREIRLRYIGPAHTVDDAFVYLPEEKVVFCGDLLFSEPCTPFALMGSIYGSIVALDYLANLNADFYIPGHGPVAGKESLYRARDYFVYIRDEAYERFKDGIDPYTAAKSIDLGEYSSWNEKERVIGNVVRAYSEFKGEPIGAELPDLFNVLARMMDYRKEIG